MLNVLGRFNRRRHRLERIETKLDLVLGLLGVLNQDERKLGMTLDDVLAQVTAMKDVEDGLGAAIDQIVAQDTDIAAKLKAALAAGGDPVKIQAIADELTAQTAGLAAKKDAVVTAVLANT